MALGSTAAGQVPPSYGFDFATIGSAGNAPYSGEDPWNLATGRGGVGYSYRIGKDEVTTAQWMEFVNAFTSRGGSWTWFSVPSIWGASNDPNYTGPGQRFILKNLPNADRIPVKGISWREAAMYCNWLCNGKSPAESAVTHGAYDTSTFTLNPDGSFNDQPTHTPGAAYWIPTYDEWLKSAYYDPARNGPGQGGWWQYPDRSDQPLIAGLPGQGQTLAGVPLTLDLYNIPLGSYPEVRSPWGLVDLSGVAEEFLEEIYGNGIHHNRGTKGSPLGLGPGFEISDVVYAEGSLYPLSHASDYGFRIASDVPAPSTIPTLLALLVLPQRRKSTCAIS